ncbi:MAG: diaminopimelate epimerase [Ruminobacter sp.]|uniref:diaminopimelate epimerase n=1 Tax=Ruminobacter sp. TaxID=2774296 RepID=UPI001B69D3EA|nr:diaminopimelate epimerase [Ruminobacter sp.]
MLINFSKMHGCGNDFMVIDAVTQKFFLSENKIKSLADRRLGVGFDHLLVVEPPYDPELDFHYRIYNPDGTEIQMGGNGARCLAKFVTEKKLINRKNIRVSTLGGKLVLTVNDDGSVLVDMGEPVLEPAKIPFRAQGRNKTYVLPVGDGHVLCGAVFTGNPHCILTVDDIESADVSGTGGLISVHERFPEKVNVGFMQVLNQHEIRLRVYERGSGEKPSCGTGACAAAVVGMDQGLLRSPVTVHFSGGDLTVEWQGEGMPVKMTGNASLVFDGCIEF